MSNQGESSNPLLVKHSGELCDRWPIKEALISDGFDLENCRKYGGCLNTSARGRVTNLIDRRLCSEECGGETRDLLHPFATEWSFSVRTDPLRWVARVCVPNEVQRMRGSRRLRSAHGFRSSTSPETR